MTASPLYHPRPERWPQASLKGLFMATALACLPAAWVGSQLHWIRQRHAALTWIESLGAEDYSYGDYPFDFHSVPAPSSLQLFGESGIAMISLGPERLARPDPYTLDDLRKLFPEALSVERSQPEN
jgi:hypothetical protein